MRLDFWSFSEFAYKQSKIWNIRFSAIRYIKLNSILIYALIEYDFIQSHMRYQLIIISILLHIKWSIRVETLVWDLPVLSSFCLLFTSRRTAILTKLRVNLYDLVKRVKHHGNLHGNHHWITSKEICPDTETAVSSSSSSSGVWRVKALHPSSKDRFSIVFTEKNINEKSVRHEEAEPPRKF